MRKGGGEVKPLIVASLSDTPLLLHHARKAKKEGADLIELRIDSFPPQKRKKVMLTIKKIKQSAKLPIIATIRSPQEQEKRADLYPLSDSERKEIFETILKEVALIDLELSSEKLCKKLIPKAHRLEKKVVLSYHDFKSIPSQGKIKSLLRKFKKLSGDILKVAGTPKSLKETKKFLQLCSSLKGIERVFIGMGKYGILSRTKGFAYGSSWTYGFVGKAMAPGQLSIKELAQL